MPSKATTNTTMCQRRTPFTHQTAQSTLSRTNKRAYLTSLGLNYHTSMSLNIERPSLPKTQMRASKAPNKPCGPTKKIHCWSTSLKPSVLKNGHWSLSSFPTGSESTVEKDGTTIWTHATNAANGPRLKSGYFSSSTENWATDGPKLQRF